jgi:hypothetical protein
MLELAAAAAAAGDGGSLDRRVPGLIEVARSGSEEAVTALALALCLAVATSVELAAGAA